MECTLSAFYKNPESSVMISSVLFFKMLFFIRNGWNLENVRRITYCLPYQLDMTAYVLDEGAENDFDFVV